MRLRAAEGPGVTFEYGDKEALLMRYLDAYGRITVAAFAQLAAIPARRASHTLVLLTRAGLLRHHLDARLHPRALLGQHELAAVEVFAWRR